MGYRTVVMLSNDQAHDWINDEGLGKKISRAMNYVGADISRNIANYGSVVQCVHGDTQQAGMNLTALRWLFTAFLAIAPLSSFALTSTQCSSYMLFREARGESLHTQRAVLDIMYNRMAKYKKSACRVFLMSGQYPYSKHGVKKVSKEWLQNYKEVVRMRRVLGKDYLYFNRVRHKFGKQSVKIGNLWFSK